MRVLLSTRLGEGRTYLKKGKSHASVHLGNTHTFAFFFNKGRGEKNLSCLLLCCCLLFQSTKAAKDTGTGQGGILAKYRTDAPPYFLSAEGETGGREGRVSECPREIDPEVLEEPFTRETKTGNEKRRTGEKYKRKKKNLSNTRS